MNPFPYWAPGWQCMLLISWFHSDNRRFLVTVEYVFFQCLMLVSMALSADKTSENYAKILCLNASLVDAALFHYCSG